MTTYRVFFNPNAFGVVSFDMQAMSLEELYDVISVLSTDSYRFDRIIDKVIVL